MACIQGVELSLMVDLTDFVWINVRIGLRVGRERIRRPGAFPKPVCKWLTVTLRTFDGQIRTCRALEDIHLLDGTSGHAQWEYPAQWL